MERLTHDDGQHRPVTTCRAGHHRTEREAGKHSGRLCRGCREDLATALAELPELDRELEYLLGPVATPRRERVSGSRSFGPVFNEEASAARAAMTSVLASWAGLVTGLVPTPAPERAVGPLAAFLLRHLDVLARHPASADLAEEVGALADRGRRAVRGPADQPVRLGACPLPGCAGELEAATGSGRAGTSDSVHCGAGHVWPTREWLTLRSTLGGHETAGARDRRTLPTRLAAQAAGVSEATVRKWASRGKLTRYGSNFRAEYDVTELMALAAR